MERLKNIRKNRKGTIIDMFYLLILFLFFGIIIVVSVYLKDQIFPELIEMLGTNITGNKAPTVLRTAEQGYMLMDNIFMMLYFMLAGSSIIFAALVRTNPVFFVLNLIMLFVLFLIAPAMSNVMREFWSQPEFAVYAAGGGGSVTFVITTRIFQYLPHISVGLSILLIIAQFAKGVGTEGM